MQQSVLAAPSNYSYLGELLGTVTPIPPHKPSPFTGNPQGDAWSEEKSKSQAGTREKNWRREDPRGKGTVWISYVYTPDENSDCRTAVGADLFGFGDWWKAIDES